MAAFLRRLLIFNLHSGNVHALKILDKAIEVQWCAKTRINVDKHRDIYRAADVLHDLTQLQIAYGVQIGLCRQCQ